MHIYFDEIDEMMDGHGWNVVDPNDEGGVAARFKTHGEAKAWAASVHLD